MTRSNLNRTLRHMVDGSCTFSSVGLLPPLCKLCDYIGWKCPTVIQKSAIPHALANKDIIGIAETGSGKTGAFLLPIIQHWMLANKPVGFGLILAPTRELAQQLACEAMRLGALSKVGSGPDLQVLCLVGGEDMVDQALKIAWRRHHLLVATPGRLIDHMKQLSQFSFQQLSQTRYLVLDEADRMLNMAFAEDLDTILGLFENPRGKRKKKRKRSKKLLEQANTDHTTKITNSSVPLTKKKFPHPHTYLYSATMTKDVVKLRRAALASDAVLIVSDPDSDQLAGDKQTSCSNLDSQQQQQLQQTKLTSVRTGFPSGLVHYCLPLRLSDRIVILDWVVEYALRDGLKNLRIKENPITDSERRIMVFCKRCHETRFVAQFLCERGHPAVCLTGKMRQSNRREALQQFTSGQAQILVATDVASRGLDVPHVELVINYSVPLSEKTYRHRVGRTARAGRSGVALTLVTRDVAHSFLELETLLLPHLPKSHSSETGLPRWPIPIPQLSGKHGLLVRRRLADEAWARAGKIIRAQDAESKMSAKDSPIEESDEDGQSDLEQDYTSTTDSEEHSDEDNSNVSSTDSKSEMKCSNLDINRLGTTGLAGIRAARKTWSAQIKARKLKRKQRQDFEEAKRISASVGWGIQGDKLTTGNEKQVESEGTSDSETSETERDHLRFDETLKTKYAKIQAAKKKMKKQHKMK